MATTLYNTTHELARLGKRRRILRAQQAAVRTQIRDAILDAYEAGVPVIEIADLVGMTRRAVYNALDESEDE